jgi:L-rhamnose mutarotase
MERVALKMKLFPGYEEEYKRRHDAIAAELINLLKDAGISEYSIFLDKETNFLFAYLTIQDKRKLNELPLSPVMKAWWEHMKDIMDTNPDGSPVSIPLQELFYLK